MVLSQGIHERYQFPPFISSRSRQCDSCVEVAKLRMNSRSKNLPLPTLRWRWRSDEQRINMKSLGPYLEPGVNNSKSGQQTETTETRVGLRKSYQRGLRFDPAPGSDE